MERLLYRLSGYLPCRLIKGFSNEQYLERYLLLRIGGIRVFLHRFCASDPDRGLHDHPWSISASLVLTGGYQELRMTRRGDPDSVILRRIRPLAINIIRGGDFHRVLIPEGRQAWSLFVHGPRTKRWGFLAQRPDGRYGSLETEDYQLMPERQHNEKEWWHTAPKGRHAKRLPLDAA